MSRKDKSKFPQIKELYPDFTLEGRTEAEDALRRYVALIWRIYQRIRRKKPKI